MSPQTTLAPPPTKPFPWLLALVLLSALLLIFGLFLYLSQETQSRIAYYESGVSVGKATCYNHNPGLPSYGGLNLTLPNQSTT